RAGGRPAPAPGGPAAARGGEPQLGRALAQVAPPPPARAAADLPAGPHSGGPAGRRPLVRARAGRAGSGPPRRRGGGAARGGSAAARDAVRRRGRPPEPRAETGRGYGGRWGPGPAVAGAAGAGPAAGVGGGTARDRRPGAVHRPRRKRVGRPTAHRGTELPP